MTATPLPTPDPARAEQARRAVSAIFLINGILFATWAVNIPGIRDQLNLTEAQIGLGLLAVGLGSLISMPFTGGWTARWGSHRVTAVMAVACMLALAPPFLTSNLPALSVALLVLGAINGSLDVAMNAQGVTVERRLSRPIMSRLHAYFSLGGVLGAALGTVLVGRVPILTHVLVVVVLTAMTAFFAGRLLLSDRASPETQDSVSAPHPPAGLSPAVLLLGSLCFLGMLAEGANYDWAALYFRDVLEVQGGNTGLGYAAFVTAMTLGRWFGDRLRARLGDEITVRGGSLLAAAGLGVALLTRDPLLATFGFALSGLGLSNVVPVMYGTAGHALAGRGIAQVATIGYGGFLLGPPAIGFVAHEIGLPGALGLALAGAALVAILGGQAFALVRTKSARPLDA
ncbi:MFS transporter [Deinococcus deserti]|uniref:Putative Major facilitator superfamily n=1 Tax=Deinococcus deserti (strain DSM 17065 / CIP 109153 / LMG 22923 / VCD115) TaxID=546414 RepID=C1CYC0_DEIDV|nr:MFS transporter [Deinococcus deserti]ACO44941.1 putative Major facilitator superfamily [Deinococcus deserti VCD115]